MAFPTSLTALGKVCQSTDGAQTEVITIPSSASGYHLGAGLSPAQPSTWINTPDGAYPILAPGAPTTGSGTGFSGGGLTASSAYSWALTNVTDYGETPAGAQLVVPNVGSFTGYILALPTITAGENTTDNPLRRRRIYRTAAGGAQLKYAGEIADLSLTTWRDWLSDAELGDNAPASNTSGVTGLVTVSGGSVSVWTERAPTTAQASLASGDYVVNRTTGNVVFSTSDYGRTSVTVAWTGETVATSSLVMSLITALRDTAAAVAAASGLASLNASGFVAQAAAQGVRQAVVCTQSNDTTASATTSAAWPGTWSPAASITTTGSSKVRVRLHIYGVCSTSLNLRAYVTINSVTYNMGAMTWVNPNRGHSTGVIETGTLAAGTYTVGVTYDVNTGTATVNASSDPTNQRAVLEIEEIA